MPLHIIESRVYIHMRIVLNSIHCNYFYPNVTVDTKAHGEQKMTHAHLFL